MRTTEASIDHIIAYKLKKKELRKQNQLSNSSLTDLSWIFKDGIIMLLPLSP